ncbi:hypothetical protein RhiTH_004545 [Rhizoctonia solani]
MEEIQLVGNISIQSGLTVEFSVTRRYMNENWITIDSLSIGSRMKCFLGSSCYVDKPEVEDEGVPICSAQLYYQSVINCHLSPFLDPHPAAQSICRHWRSATFDTKALWSLVTLSDRPPFHFSALCLDRSGTTSPLDVEIEINNRFWQHIPDCDPNTRVQAVHGALTFILAHGGIPSRWRSLWLYTPGSQRSNLGLHIAALDIIGAFPMPSLQYIELKCSIYHYGGGDQTHILSLPAKPLFRDPSPTQLRVAKLEWIPRPYLFVNPGYPQLVGLNHLEIRFPLDLPELEHMKTLLDASPMLRVLSLDLRATSPQISAELIYLPKIHIPSLQVLALSANSRTHTPRWGHNLLLMIDAPNVESLRFQLEYSGADPLQDQELIDYITRGANPANPRALFPSLTALELSIDQDHTGLFEQFLTAYSLITTLYLPHPTYGQVEALRMQPWLVPELTCLAVKAERDSTLRDAIFERCSAGLPLKTVLVELSPVPLPWIRRSEARLREYLEGLDVRIILTKSNTRARKMLGFVE